ncbi:hypothetical protein GXW78_06075 [Roseomonas terrae]|uniref:Uncharacterized protein n=1 Tax=Neoroseomonas terrae TaxID=424799 RepID=A0ABS5EDX7_9PROT|nr:hypothetical protein [Neoroseomonas terrae]MBR0649221.1 hypothetical protein [Neoroseomonas terrae]
MINQLSRRVESLEAKTQDKDAPLQIVCAAAGDDATIERAMLKKFGTPEAPPGANMLLIVTGVERHSDDEA